MWDLGFRVEATMSYLNIVVAVLLFFPWSVVGVIVVRALWKKCRESRVEGREQ